MEADTARRKEVDAMQLTQSKIKSGAGPIVTPVG
jgi:hypothetical protein